MSKQDALTIGIDSIIERLMKREHASSGTPIFVDRVVLRQILEDDLRFRWPNPDEPREWSER